MITVSLMALPDTMETQKTSEIEESAKPIKIKFNFRYKCNSKIGICLIIEFSVEPLNPGEYEEGYGTATATYSENESKLTLKFDRPIATEDNQTVDIYDNWDLGNDYASKLGLHSIKIKKGVYPVDLSIGEFGQATFDVITE